MIYKTNGRISFACNVGLEVFKSEHVVFVDGDDFLKSDCISYFLKLVVDNGCDIAMNMRNQTFIACLQYVDKIAVGEKMVYHQVFNRAIRSFKLESNHRGMRSMEKQKSIRLKSNKKVEYAWVYHYRCFYAKILYGLV